MNNRRNKDKIITCAFTNCLKKDCPNYAPYTKSDSVPFLSCMYKPGETIKEPIKSYKQ